MGENFFIVPSKKIRKRRVNLLNGTRTVILNADFSYKSMETNPYWHFEKQASGEHNVLYWVIAKVRARFPKHQVSNQVVLNSKMQLNSQHLASQQFLQ